MPIVRLSLLKGRTNENLAAISDAIHNALVSDFGMPDEDRFQVITQYDPHEISFNRTFWGGPRSDGFMMLSILGGPAPTVKSKQAFFKAVVRNLEATAGVNPEDVFITMQEADVSDFSFGGGRSLVPDE